MIQTKNKGRYHNNHQLLKNSGEKGALSNLLRNLPAVTFPYAASPVWLNNCNLKMNQ